MNRKLKKLIKNPNLFFRDYFYKKFNSTQIVESSSTLTVNEKVVNKVQNPVLTQDFSFLISGSLDSCLSFLRKNFKFEDPKVLFFGYEEQYYQFFYENKEWRYEEIEKNPLSTYRDGYSCFLHSSDVISSNFFKSCLISIKKNKPDLIVPGYFEARNHISQPTVRLRKCGGVFYESIYGLVVKNETIRKIDLYDENYWGALDGSQLLVGLLSFIDLKKIETIRNIKYIYVRKPFGSGFREVNSLDIDQWIISFLHGTKRYVSDSKVENASTLQKSIIYIFNNILNLGFKKKDLAWDTNYSFEKMANDILNKISINIINIFKPVLGVRNEYFIRSSLKQEIPIKILIRDFDYKNDEVLFNFYCSSIEEAEAVFSSILKGVVRHKKITRHHYFTDDSVFEGRCWVQFDEKINDELCFFNYSIDFLGKEHKYIKYSLIKSFYKKRKYKFDYSKKYDNCWLVMDRDDQADDNAEHFYRYLKELENFDKKVYFCLKSSSHDWARLQDEGFSLIDYGTEEYERALNAADKIISSHAAAFVFDYFRDKRLFQKDLVFLQHGVIYNDLSTLFEPEWKKIKLFVTSATDEYKSLVGDGGAYRYTNKEVVLTGLPRHDSLLAKYENYKSTSELSAQRILIMPTWRPYLLGAVKTGTERELLENFESTEYFKAWMSFLKSESLKNLSDSGVIIEFFPHANIQPYIELFDIPEHVQLMTFSNVSIQDLFVRASLMITDYSSVAFEMAYLQKPVIYYQFDVDDFYRKGVYNKGYFDSKDNGFGPVVYEEADLLYEVEQLHMAQFQLSGAYKERVEKFFPYRDGKCCERLLSEILKRDFYKNTEDTDKSTVLNSMLKKGLFRNALNLLKNNQLEQYSSLKSFLLWRLDGVLPEFTEDDGYKRAYDFDKHLISFDLEKCIKFKINESNLTIGEQIFVDEIKEYKKSISRFLECNEPIANFIEAPYFFRRFINLYFNLNFLYFFKENFVDFTKFKSVSKFLSNDLNIYSQFSKCLKSKKTSLEFELYIEKGEFNSRPLKILRELWVEGKKLNEISVSDCDLDISSLRMCDYFMSRIEKNRLSSFN